ncbi:Plant specific eukaryotic initiation factor 4B [Carex littledalei]|uniref:Plant specific eukaryotic initiation factor 4B n=1 Tax=Carex littledalei TaxID=544730 RepID=A0A833R8W4_9POAL|nr:Plant specific eukaryotic initiation factor 4B [Carex littledalei]
MERAKESSFGFSWADEVEREEEREKENQIRIQREKQIGENIKKSDPFGAARPREVVLEEKGVDWKILDQDFNFDSSIRECKTKRIPKKKPLGIQNSRTNLPCQQTVSCEELVPPLKYPPKNINSVFKEIHRARKPKPDTCPNLMGSNTKRVSTNSSNGLGNVGALSHRDSKLSRNQNTSSNLNRVLVNCNSKKEKTGSNFEAKAVKENGMKKEEQVQRRVLVELNNSSCQKVPCSNSYFGVLELLEPSSPEKSNSKKRSAVSSASEEFEDNFVAELEAGKKNRDKPTVRKMKRGKRSNK